MHPACRQGEQQVPQLSYVVVALAVVTHSSHTHANMLCRLQACTSNSRVCTSPQHTCTHICNCLFSVLRACNYAPQLWKGKGQVCPPHSSLTLRYIFRPPPFTLQHSLWCVAGYGRQQGVRAHTISQVMLQFTPSIRLLCPQRPHFRQLAWLAVSPVANDAAQYAQAPPHTCSFRCINLLKPSHPLPNPQTRHVPGQVLCGLKLLSNGNEKRRKFDASYFLKLSRLC